MGHYICYDHDPLRPPIPRLCWRSTYTACTFSILHKLKYLLDLCFALLFLYLLDSPISYVFDPDLIALSIAS